MNTTLLRFLHGSLILFFVMGCEKKPPIVPPESPAEAESFTEPDSPPIESPSQEEAPAEDTSQAAELDSTPIEAESSVEAVAAVTEDNSPSLPDQQVSPEDSVPKPTLSAPTFRSAEAAQEFAKSQRQSASDSFKDEKKPQAYEQALAGWQALQPHLSVEECKALADELLSDLERYGEGLSTDNHGIDRKPLQIQ